MRCYKAEYVTNAPYLIILNTYNYLLSPTDILKHTEKTSPDHAALEQALDKIKSVMTFINDDKRKTEAKLKLFEIHNDIEMCPVSHNIKCILSFYRPTKKVFVVKWKISI